MGRRKRLSLHIIPHCAADDNASNGNPVRNHVPGSVRNRPGLQIHRQLLHVRHSILVHNPAGQKCVE